LKARDPLRDHVGRDRLQSAPAEHRQQVPLEVVAVVLERPLTPLPDRDPALVQLQPARRGLRERKPWESRQLAAPRRRGD